MKRKQGNLNTESERYMDMKVGAVITAAGMSTRMKQFKQMMPIGDLTIAQTVVINFQKAGIKDILMVTGYQSELLKKSLEHLDITFVENNDYEHTDMFASAKLGLERFMEGYDRVLFCPVDIPFFMKETVDALLKCSAPIVIPRYSGRKGHPVSISCRLLPVIITYTGDRGLKGAMDSSGAKTAYVDVDDPGILLDADTREDYERLQNLYEKGQYVTTQNQAEFE